MVPKRPPNGCKVDPKYVITKFPERSFQKLAKPFPPKGHDWNLKRNSHFTKKTQFRGQDLNISFNFDMIIIMSHIPLLPYMSST